jgi:hypothetical protein
MLLLLEVNASQTQSGGNMNGLTQGQTSDNGENGNNSGDDDEDEGDQDDSDDENDKEEE